MSRYAHLAFTEAVRQVQHQRGSSQACRRLLAHDGSAQDPLGTREADFITGRDGFYLASVSETGWPYVQYRGGPPGFVHVPDHATLAWLDVEGNRQYITTGNLRSSDRVALFFMDYARQLRLKLFGRARTQPPGDAAGVLASVTETRTAGRAGQIVVVQVEGYSWNCPQHITPRFTLEEIGPALDRVQQRISTLEAENRELRAQLAAAHPH